MSSRARRPATTVAAVVAALLGAGLLVTGGTVAAIRVRADAPAPHVAVVVPMDITLPGAPPAPLPLPPSGSVAVDGDALPGTTAPLARRDADTPRPIASVAKSLTALTVLALRPLASATDAGPSYTITAADVAEYRNDLAAGGSVVPVATGEVFTERQLLMALMLPSGNNIAETLARWAGGGDRAAFLMRADALARTLGMVATHMADASGFDPATVSTAADLVRLGRAVLASPALAAVVATRHATLPDGTVVENLDTGLNDVPGWLGIKTGNSDAAGGCLLFAARREVTGGGVGGSVTVVGSVLGIHSLAAGATGTDDRAAAIDAAERAVTRALGDYTAVSPDGLPASVGGSVTTDWGNTSAVGLGTAVVHGGLVARAGDRLPLRLVTEVHAAPLSAGSEVARIEVTGPGGAALVGWPVVVTRDVPGPGIWWRLRYG